MSGFRAVAAIVSDSVTPDPTVVRHRARITLDRILTLLITLLAIGLAVAYQVLSRWGHLIFHDDA